MKTKQTCQKRFMKTFHKTDFFMRCAVPGHVEMGKYINITRRGYLHQHDALLSCSASCFVYSSRLAHEWWYFVASVIRRGVPINAMLIFLKATIVMAAPKERNERCVYLGDCYRCRGASVSMPPQNLISSRLFERMK